jgi:hypothetical protein
MVLQIIVLILELVHLVFGVFGIPIYRMYKGGGVFVSTLLCWGLYIIWAFTWCVILPAIVYPYSKEVFGLFPDAIRVPFIIVLGCVPSLLVCSIAYGVIRATRPERKAQINNGGPEQSCRMGPNPSSATPR